MRESPEVILAEAPAVEVRKSVDVRKELDRMGRWARAAFGERTYRRLEAECLCGLGPFLRFRPARGTGTPP